MNSPKLTWQEIMRQRVAEAQNRPPVEAQREYLIATLPEDEWTPEELAEATDQIAALIRPSTEVDLGEPFEP
jgi:hypothetical protein